MDFYIGEVTFLDLYFRKMMPCTFHCEGQCFLYKILFRQRFVQLMPWIIYLFTNTILEYSEA